MRRRPGQTDDCQIVRVRGIDLRVRVEGDGEPLLLLNGLTRPLESWQPLIQALPGRRLISFDAPGVGGSPTPMFPLSIATLARLATGVLDAAGADRADVLGFSHGGAVAQQLAVQAPSRLRRLVLVSTSCGAGATPGREDALRSSLRRSSEARAWPPPSVLGALWHSLAISAWSSIPFLGAIAGPTLVVCGAHDRMVPPANSSMLARRIPGAELVLLPAGHDLQRQGTARILAEVVDPFLSGVGTGVTLPLGA